MQILPFDTASVADDGSHTALKQQPAAASPRYSVFPNPATDNVFVGRLGTGKADADIRVLSMTGQLLRVATLKAGEQRTVILLKGLSAGAYTVEVNDHAGTTERMVITVK